MSVSDRAAYIKPVALLGAKPEHGMAVRGEIPGDDVELAKALSFDALDIVNHRSCLAPRIRWAAPCDRDGRESHSPPWAPRRRKMHARYRHIPRSRRAQARRCARG